MSAQGSRSSVIGVLRVPGGVRRAMVLPRDGAARGVYQRCPPGPGTIGAGVQGCRGAGVRAHGWIGPSKTGRPDHDPRHIDAYPEAVADLKTEQILALLAPIVIIELGLLIVALHDLEQEDRHVRGGSKLVWALVIVFVNVVGPIIYLVAGREEA